MTLLTIHLSHATNLSDGNRFDKADPYVKFEIEQDNLIFDNDFGEQISSKKKNEKNPRFNETFRFELPTLENMELKCTVMDDDVGLDDKLGKCKLNLDELNLNAEPLEITRKIDDNLFSPDSWIFLRLTWGQPANDDDDATNLSHVGRAAYECLRIEHPEHHGRLWNVTRGAVVGNLHQTPEGAWPGGPSHPEGHSDYFPEKMGEILSRTEVWADVLSLGPPDGKFMESFKKAMGVIAENAEGKEKPVIVRMMFGNIVGMPTNCNAVRDELVADLDNDANIRLWVGAWRRGVTWNHAKIIAVDGRHLHTGGHNMWDAHYLEYDPIHDLSLELEGECALDGHRFANRQWDFIETNHETFWGTVGSKLPDYLPQVANTRVIVSEWPRGQADEHAPVFRAHFVEERATEDDVENSVPIITMGRYGALTHQARPADDAFIAMMDSAQTVLRLALQDLGPVCIPQTKIPLPGTSWPKNYFAALGRAIWERGVDVEIVLSNPGSIPAGLSPLEACYGNGWDCNDVSSEIIKTIRENHPDAEDGDLRQKVVDNLRVCFIREEGGGQWEDGMNMGMHAKHFIVDDQATYIGSQNLYVCDLAEWGVVIDDKEKTEAMMEEYWTPMWEHSFTGEDVDVDAVMDGLDIDRDGANPDEIDEDTKEQMKIAELANAGCAHSDFYGSEDE